MGTRQGVAALALGLALAACGSDSKQSSSSASGGSGAGGNAGSGTTGGQGGSSKGAAGGQGGASGSNAGSGQGGSGGVGGSAAAGGAGGSPDLITATPPASDDPLPPNPGRGATDFHLGWWCNLPPSTFSPEDCAQRVRDNWPENHPQSSTAYFRWHWSDIEPVRGQIDFDMIDLAIQSAAELGEAFSFRVMTIAEGASGVPDWLLQAPYSVPTQSFGGTVWPDVRDASFQAEHARLIAALGARYDSHPVLDHVDIGTVGCWGEWNTACISGVSGLFDVYSPENPAETQAIADAYQSMIDDHIDAFPATPTVMLAIGDQPGPERDLMVHALGRGAGWRVDCWGDWGVFGPSWNHMENLYPQWLEAMSSAYSEFEDHWQVAPVQLEVCGTLPDWENAGWSASGPGGEVYKTFEWAREVHASVLNLKSTDIPAAYTNAVEQLVQDAGYRFRVESVTHPARVSGSASVDITTVWNNLGIAPSYRRRFVRYRLRGGSDVHELVPSSADIRDWAPGMHTESEALAFANGAPPPGSYELEVAILALASGAVEPADFKPLPPLYLANLGRGDDGWYSVSQLVVE